MVGDKLAMANGLEERFPFLDNELVEFAQKIPVRHKLGNLEKEIKMIDENTPGKKKLYRKQIRNHREINRIKVRHYKKNTQGKDKIPRGIR